VDLKTNSYNEKNIALISKLINQKIVFILEYSGKAKLAIFHQKLLQTPWNHLTEIDINIKGLNLDKVWENMLVQVSGIEIQADKTIDDQIKTNDLKAKLQKQIDAIEKQARVEKQPKKKFDLVVLLNKLEIEMENLN